MMTQKFRILLEDYQNKKWFPSVYPDPFGELVDYVSAESVSDFQKDWIQSAKPGSLFAAYWLKKILTQRKYRDLFRDFEAAMARPVGAAKVRAPFIYYYIRSISEEESRQLWTEFQSWSEFTRPAIQSWNQTRIRDESLDQELFKQFHEFLGIDHGMQLDRTLKNLTATGELYEWKSRQRVITAEFREWVRYLRLPWADMAADWSDFPAFAASLKELGHVRATPALKKTEREPGIQQLFAISSPARVVLEYGKAAGPLDLLRFLMEFGKGCFYSGMNPSLPAENRIWGDPTLPLFWGFLFGQMPAETHLLSRMISTETERLATEFTFALETGYRYDLMLSLYAKEASMHSDAPQDAYPACFNQAFPFLTPPSFLSHYDLARAEDAVFRIVAYESAAAAVERLKELYGNQWLFSSAFAAKCSEYWHEGFTLTLKQMLKDWKITVPATYPFL